MLRHLIGVNLPFSLSTPDQMARRIFGSMPAQWVPKYKNIRNQFFMFTCYLDMETFSNLVFHGLMRAQYLPQYRKTVHFVFYWGKLNDELS